MLPNGIPVISVEEFIPADDVTAMLRVADKLTALDPDKLGLAGDNLKRSIVWMARYIAPTKHFWDWPSFKHQIEDGPEFRVVFVGLGWLVSLRQAICSTDTDAVVASEGYLADLLTRITGDVSVEAVCRLKSTDWTPTDLRALTKHLRKDYGNSAVTLSGRRVHVGEVVLNFSNGETVYHPRLSEALDSETRELLLKVKAWANADGKFQGADWCGYKRRRLTLLIKNINGSVDTPEESDFLFSDRPGASYARIDRANYDTVYRTNPDGMLEAVLGYVVFPRYGFHLGVTNPRVVLGLSGGVGQPAEIERLVDYLSYLWVNHYTRLWLYLEFEDHYSFVDSLWRRPQLTDQALHDYSKRSIRVEELRQRIQGVNVVDAGQSAAYIPPHESFKFEPKVPGATSAPRYLRTSLIPHSTVTQLEMDPLLAAPQILEDAARDLERMYGFFAQTSSLRMQRALQILQILFVFAAAIQFVLLVPLADALDANVLALLEGIAPYESAVAFLHSQLEIPESLDLSLSLWRLLVVSVLTYAAFLILRSRRFSQWLVRHTA